MQKTQTQHGYVALLSVLVVGAVALALAASLLQLGVGSSLTNFALEQSTQAQALADACAEEALQQIRTTTSFTGSGNLSLGQGSCTYTVTDTGGETRDIDSTGTVGTVVRKVGITLSAINPSLTISAWQEVGDF